MDRWSHRPGDLLPGSPVAIAHRGGAAMAVNAGRENSLASFEAAIDLGVTYLELDVRSSSDGEAFVFHDDDLGRVTGRSGPLEALTAAQVDAIRLDGGDGIPRLADVLDAFPGAWVNVDVKSDAVIDAAIGAIDGAGSGAWDRVVVAAFSHERLLRVRHARPQALTSTSPREIGALRFGGRLGRDYVGRGGAVCTQVPVRHRGATIVTGSFVRAAHLLGLPVHVWTIDEPAEMSRLLDAGVDGIVTDRPDTLVDVLRSRGQWHGPNSA
ncbi:glycerophosphodiester phosphodiesterase family protein [Pseudactinotalea sp. HY158]|uniref:glycerophosphodiester phosphodiesterase family protein n=1 Tax=Pseudactinotalea sp. HY158 TaxID=2654547 RepID=UPI00129C5FE8|nr:glycerophosphodiester phosphodiesterase family protein [Pseudactinotalea sp. HY158]QGH69520.1 glycerophosphodiester phosphodiesterase [Pseudactinotalea sp. HY158]